MPRKRSLSTSTPPSLPSPSISPSPPSLSASAPTSDLPKRLFTFTLLISLFSLFCYLSPFLLILLIGFQALEELFTLIHSAFLSSLGHSHHTSISSLHRIPLVFRFHQFISLAFLSLIHYLLSSSSSFPFSLSFLFFLFIILIVTVQIFIITPSYINKSSSLSSPFSPSLPLRSSFLLLSFTLILCHFYVTYCCYHFIILIHYAASSSPSSLSSGLYLIIGVVILTANGENVALSVGKIFRSSLVSQLYSLTPLAIYISPNKSIEGAVGQIAGTVVSGIVMENIYRGHYKYMVIPDGIHHDSDQWNYCNVGYYFLISLMGVIGDLIESLLKRLCDVKDMGKILPAVGGIMDRVDGIMLVIPFVSLYWEMEGRVMGKR